MMLSRGKRAVCFVDSFSVGLDELNRRDAGTLLTVVKLAAERGRFSCFEASANPIIAGTVTTMMRSGLVESYVPERYKSKPEPGGARAPDQSTYPWTYVRLTDAGRRALANPASGEG